MTSAPAGQELRELLREHGFTPVKAELWAEFVTHVTAILQAAAAELRDPAKWAAFKLKRGALGVPRRRARRKVVERVPIEDAITSELAHIVRHLRRTVPKGHFLRLNEVVFYDEYLVASPIRAGRHSRKIDFLICANTGIDEPELPIEAKPLVVEADITRRYLAEEGIGCFFTTDSPYTLGPLGALLAYTLNRDGRSWRAEVRAAIGAYVPPVLGVADALIYVDSEPTTFSRHERLALELDPIAILHLEMLFELAEIPSEQPSDSGAGPENGS
jgi:hypothetical protein